MIFRIIIPLLMFAATASAAPFAPEPLKISGPSGVTLSPGEYPVQIPVSISGGPATVTLAIFTSDQGASIRNIRNGNLGWHAVNCIDTCFYVSPPYRLPSGKSTIEWNGRDENDYQFLWRSFTYYLIALADSVSPAKAFRFPASTRFDRSALRVYDTQSNPLANPVFFSSAQSLESTGETWNTRSRWTLGDDPDDSSLLETTRYRTRPDRGRMALDPRDYRRFFTQSLEPGLMVTRAWEWMPKGDAVLWTAWGDNGLTSVPSALDPDTSQFSGPVAMGEMYLFSTGLAPMEAGYYHGLDGIDIDGGLIQRFDLSRWWGSGTNAPDLAYGMGSLFLSSPGSALFLMVNPLAGMEDEVWLMQWENGSGDGFADIPSQPGETHDIAMDGKRCALFTESSPEPAVGVFTPDGTGAGLFSLRGLTGSPMDGMQVIDTGTAYDGMYYGTPDNSGAVLHAGYSVFKGVLWFNGELWYPYIRLIGPYRNQELHAGSEYSIIWEGNSYGSERIELSTDGGATWALVAEVSRVADGFVSQYVWRVADVRSSTCRLRIITGTNTGLVSTSPEFTITGPVAVNDAAPRVFALRPNTPNPFNPSTTLSFILPAPGDASLTVYDVTGRKVTELSRGFLSAGEHAVTWNATGCASGVYFAVLKAGEKTETRKMLLVR